MKRTSKAGTIIVLFWSAFVFAQAPPTLEKKPDSPSSRPEEAVRELATTGAVDQSGCTFPESMGVEVTTNTQGVNFGPYLQRVLHDVKQNWYYVIPASAMPPLLKKGKLSIEFAITRNGQIVGLRYRSGSGNAALDRAAYGGIMASNPFQPLPAEFHGQYIGLRFTFFYNPSLSGISPLGAQVRAGSSLQFSPVLKGNAGSTDSVISWSVGGQGCTGSECGTISEAGLYAAPLRLPENPNVTVKATASGDLGETACTVVTIVPPEASQNTGQH